MVRLVSVANDIIYFCIYVRMRVCAGSSWTVHNEKFSRRYRPVYYFMLVHYCSTTWYGVGRNDI